MAEGRVTRRFPPRFYPKCLVALLLAAGLVGLLLHLSGASADRFYVYLSLATLWIILAALAWEIIERRVLRPRVHPPPADEQSGRFSEGSAGAPPDGTRSDGDLTPPYALDPHAPGLLAWLAFPASIAFGVASLPFLVLLVYPPVEQLFTEAGRVQASLSRSEDGAAVLDVDFPEPTTEEGENLRINGKPLPAKYLRDHPEVFLWRDAQTLSVRVEPLLRDLGLERIETVEINLLARVPRFTYLSGETVPRQVVDVR